MKRPFEREDASLRHIRSFKGVVMTDERRNTVHDYLDLGLLVEGGEARGR